MPPHLLNPKQSNNMFLIEREIHNFKQIREECQELVLSNDTLKTFMEAFESQIQKGLKKSTHDEAEIKCFVTYVQSLPTGNETGKFLALDLGGTNFRVLVIHLKGYSEYKMDSKIYAIPQNLMVGSGTQLFDHIADCLANFMKEHKLEHEVLPLGFTFSFPCQQVGLTKGVLIKWTKGFNCEGVVNADVVQLLEEALAKRNDVKIKICAILNDTTGTLMSCAWKYLNCKIGAILGTGSNACYVEKVRNAELFDGASKGDNVIINCEWGAFGDKGSLDFVRTDYDRIVDENSINKGNQLFEKMISGMYMGEIVRLVLVKFTKAGLLFQGKSSNLLETKDKFFTKYVSEIESDSPGDFTNMREVLQEMDLEHATDEDCVNVRYICECVSSRAAYIVSAALSSLIIRMDDPDITVGIDGSLYRFHPKFHDLMTAKIKELVPSKYRYKLVLSEDGSGRGAALIAAVAATQIK